MYHAHRCFIAADCTAFAAQQARPTDDARHNSIDVWVPGHLHRALVAHQDLRLPRHIPYELPELCQLTCAK